MNTMSEFGFNGMNGIAENVATKEWRSQAECTDKWISCDGCHQWFFYQCANAYSTGNTPPGGWYCKVFVNSVVSHLIHCLLIKVSYPIGSTCIPAEPQNGQ